jgi:cyclopropane fatty-acyl-phospholipid synthase-like methyltransferase
MKEAFQKQYDEKSAPWNYDGFDKDFDEIFEKLNPRSTVVDLGCGNGSQAYHIQKIGFDVTGTDVVNALEYKLNNFVLDDALQSKLTEKYDVIIDRGLIHNLFHLKETRHKYFEMIGNITHDDSYIILKVLSPYEARFNPSTHSGPYRFNEKQLEGFYSGFGFKCVELKDTLFYTNLQPHLRGYLGIYKKEL